MGGDGSCSTAGSRVEVDALTILLGTGGGKKIHPVKEVEAEAGNICSTSLEEPQ